MPANLHVKVLVAKLIQALIHDGICYAFDFGLRAEVQQPAGIYLKTMIDIAELSGIPELTYRLYTMCSSP